ncbi:MAG TPA: riboflavin synthase [Candidatus Angelobacter sp.]
MFTGLIIETGRVAAVRRNGGKTRITIAAKQLPAELHVGDSVAVSGVCLTAVDVKRNHFSADLAEETLKRTSLGNLKKGSPVNLELPARAEDRLGGHVVQGHIDGTARLISLKKIKGGEDWRLTLELPPELERYVVPQGSITVEGISLTVADIKGTRAEIAIIPHTYKVTNLNTLRPGSPLNVEVDVLAKYAERLNTSTTEARRHGGKQKAGLSVEDLVRRGF